MPDDLFAPLGEGPVPPLARAADVRARGDQRRRRSRAALAGAGALTAALALGGGYALLGSGPDALTPSPAGPARTSPSAAPSTPSSGPPSDAPSTAPATGVADLLLTVDDAERVEPADWSTVPAPEEPLLDPCPGGTDYPADADRTDTASIALQTLREAGGTDVSQTLARYRDAQAAADAVAGYDRAVRGCPGAAPDSPDPQVGHQVLSSGSQDGTTTVVVRMSQGFLFATYLAVQQRGDLVSVLRVGYGEDGDPGVQVIEPYLPVVADALAQG